MESYRNANVSVGTSSQLISPLVLQGKRIEIGITNTSTAGEIVTISFDKEAVANQGIVLTAYGSVYFASQDSGYNPTNKEIYAVASAGTATIAVLERLIV